MHKDSARCSDHQKEGSPYSTKSWNKIHDKIPFIDWVSNELCNKYLHLKHKNHSRNEQIIRIEREYTSKQLNLQS